METCRFFVSKLPIKTTEEDLKELFKKYGTIEKVELKTKGNLVDAEDKKIIGFVTLDIGSKEAQNCINDLQHYTVHGQQISVELAKESFLERLKREREEVKSAKFGKSKDSVVFPDSPHDTQSNINSQNKRKTFNIYEDLKEDGIEPELMITKKRAANSMRNGKIVIQSQTANKALHIIKNQKAKGQQPSNMKAEQKRKESVNKMKQDYKEKKNAIQQALKGLDQRLKSKKITFSNEECELNSHNQTDHCVTQLFSDDDSNEGRTKTEELQVKSLLMGRMGSRLAKLQSNQTLDARFRMDETFLEAEEYDPGNEDNEIDDENCKTSGNDERKWQMNILEQVVGASNVRKNYGMTQGLKKQKQMLRYDPNNKEHQKNAEQEKEEEKTKLLETQKVLSEEVTQKINTHQVSKEAFYMITDTLQESLKKPSEGFSLLSMFDNSHHLEERHEQLKKLSHEKILLHNNKLEKSLTRNPFNYDSSCSESEADDDLNEVHQGNDQKNQKIKSKLKISQEPFFITTRDKRLKEGANFFRFDKKSENENYDEVRQRLKQIIKKKISKTRKNFLNAGFKAKRKRKTC